MSVVQVTRIHDIGRFGNQLFLYAFARHYSEVIGAQLELPAWAGETLFKLPQHRPSRYCTPLPSDTLPAGEGDIDLFGFYQLNACLRSYRSQVHKWFEFQEPIQPESGIALHVRRGDYIDLAHKYCLVSPASYAQLLEKLPPELPRSWYYEAGVRWPFARCGVADWQLDFRRMVAASHLVRSNSTFSFWAGLLHQGIQVYAPQVGDLVGESDVPFVDGNWPKLYSKFDDYDKVI